MMEGLRMDLMRWLVWDNMRGGLLVSYLLFFMGGYDDVLFGYLRRGEFLMLMRWEGLDDGLFVGLKGEVEKVIRFVMGSLYVGVVKGLLGMV